MFVMSRAEKLRVEKLLYGGEALEKSAEHCSPALDSKAELQRGNLIPEWLWPLFRQAGISSNGAAKFLLLALILACVCLCLALAGQSLFLLLPAAAVFLIGFAYLKLLAFKRAESFEKDYTALLLSLSSGVRTGMDPLSALCHAEKLFEAKTEMAQELRRFNSSIERGSPEEQAIDSFGGTIEHPDVRLFQTAFILARKQGSSLSHCLYRLARVTRNRQSFRRKMRGAVAMQRLSSFGIAACAMLIVGIQAATNPDGLGMAWSHPIGNKALLAAGVLVTVGLGWMLKLTRSRI